MSSNNNNPSTTASKKPKTSNHNDFDVLRQYILECPHFNSTENAAVKAALSGLEQEVKRRERGAKLQRKFSSQEQKTTAATATTAASTQKTSQSTKTMTDNNKSNTPMTTSDDDFMNEWQDIAEDRKKSSSSSKQQQNDNDEDDGVEIVDVEGETSFLGQLLSDVSIPAIAESHTRAQTPVAAIAVALHASLRSDILGFVCTGIPDDQPKKGFAAPVRALPKGQFLPKDWDKQARNNNNSHNQYVILRYRKEGTGSVHLKVETVPDQTTQSSQQKMVSVKLIPANSAASQEGESLVFPLDQHINLDSWNAALRVAANYSGGIEPALHYKGLPALLSLFAKTFDLGSICDTTASTQPTMAKDNVPFVPPPMTTGTPRSDKNNFPPPLVVGDPRGYRGSNNNYYENNGPTLENSFPPHRPFVGDFSGDLAPGGGIALDPLRRAGPDMSGNMMGPNHPAFRGGVPGGVPSAGGGGRFGMNPRFDPFGPPGGPQEIIDPDNDPTANGRQVPPHLRPARSGDPNPDHLKPPNSLGNNSFGGNMFM